MAGNWPLLRLKEAGVTLLDCDHRTPAEAQSGRPYVAIPQMKNGEIDLSEARLISEADYVDWTRKTAPKPFDVLLSRRCNPGETAHVREGQEFAVGQNLVLLRTDGSKIIPEYMRWMAASPDWWSEVERFRNPGAVFDSLKCRDIVQFELPIPPVEVQAAISRLLSALDDKIELNKRIANTLGTMKRALFKSWLIDFEPVYAKEEGQATGLDVDLAGLFPDTFESAGLPRGWTAKPLSELARFLNGIALQKYPAGIGEESLPVIKIAELRSGPTIKSGRASVEIPTNFRVEDGDHLFSWSGSLIHCRWTHGKGALNQHLFKVTPLEEIPEWLVFEAVEQHLPAFRAIASGKAVTMGHIQRHHLDEASVALPPTDLLAAMDAIIAPLHKRQLIAGLESKTLTDLRDALLPKLISGEIGISDASLAMGMAA